MRSIFLGGISMARYITSITQAIGNTPLLRLDKLAAKYGVKGEIYAKLEHLTPALAKKTELLWV